MIDKDIQIALIGVVGTLLGTILGFFLSTINESLKEKRQAKTEVQQAINEVVHTRIMNDYPVVMNNLRKAIVKNAHQINNKKLIDFFEKWLNNQTIHLGMPILNVYSSLEVDIIVDELLDVKL